jgi:acyl-CoA synthetase (AMP-forming)/AMP-acid ligase II
VVGKPDPRWGEVVVAVVVPEPGTAPDPGEVTAFCRARLAGYKCPREVQVWDDLPRNSMGKIQRFIIRDRVAADPV